MSAIDHAHHCDAPTCLGNAFLRIEKGPWGLHVKAKRRIVEGTVITRNASFSHKYYQYQYESNSADSNTTSTGTSCCSFCSTSSSSTEAIRLFRCSACRLVKYCGRDCQKLDFPQHKRECQYLQTIHKQWDGGDVQRQEIEETCLLLRTFGELRRCHGQCKAGPVDGNGVATIACSTHHWNAMVRAVASETADEEDVFLLSRNRTLESVSTFTTWTATETRDALQVFQANNFAIVNNLHETIGQGVFPHAALLNHSCDPNCLLRFNSHNSSNNSKNTVLEIVAMRTIEEGEELTHSYVDLVEDSETRRRRLHDVHDFVCECRRCKGNITVELPRTVPANLYAWITHHRNPIAERTEQDDSIEISERGSQGELISISVDDALLWYGGQTDFCGPNEALSSPGSRENHKVQDLLLESRRHFAANNIEGEVSALQEALKTMLETRPAPPPLSRDLYQLRGKLLPSLLVSMSDMADNEHDDDQAAQALVRESAETCRAMVAFLLVTLPANHPLLGLQLFTLGDLTGDRSFHKWARRILRISHGPSHDLVRRLDSIIYP